MIYALVKDGKIVKKKDFDGEAPSLSENKGQWLPLTTAEKPAYNKHTQSVEKKLTISEQGVEVGFDVKDKDLGSSKDSKKKEVLAEALSRVGELPALSDFDIYDVARSSFDEIDGLTTLSEIKLYNAKTSPKWPKDKKLNIGA